MSELRNIGNKILCVEKNAGFLINDFPRTDTRKNNKKRKETIIIAQSEDVGDRQDVAEEPPDRLGQPVSDTKINRKCPFDSTTFTNFVIKSTTVMPVVRIWYTKYFFIKKRVNLV